MPTRVASVSAFRFGLVSGLSVALSIVLLGSGCTEEASSDSADGSTDTTDTTALPLADDASCDPDESEGGMQGRWFGYPEETEATSIVVDPACWLDGDDAIAAAAEDGEESPPNGYYIQNQHAGLRTVEVAEGAEVIWYPDVGDPESMEVVSYSDWIDLRGDRPTTLGLWLSVDETSVVAFEEQWVP